MPDRTDPEGEPDRSGRLRGRLVPRALAALLAERPEDSYAAVLLARSLERQGRDAEAAPYLERARVLGQDL